MIQNLQNCPVEIVVKDIAISAGGLRFNTSPGQIVQRCQRLTAVATCLQSYVAQALCYVDGLATRYMLRRYLASINEDLIFSTFRAVTLFTGASQDFPNF